MILGGAVGCAGSKVDPSVLAATAGADVALLAAALIVISFLELRPLSQEERKEFSVAREVRHDRDRRVLHMLRVLVAATTIGGLLNITAMALAIDWFSLMSLLIGLLGVALFGIISLRTISCVLSAAGRSV